MAESAGWRWVPHPEHVWVPGRKKLANVWTSIDNEDLEYKQGEIDESKLEGVSEISLGKDLDNLVNLDEFGEGAIIHQLRKRYVQDKIYTNIGTILVSVNPYKLLPIYTSSSVDKYREDYTNMAPHAFQIAADAYKRLLDEGMNQAVIISGESGAGKTEATKTVLQYLSDVAGSTSNVEQQILQSNPCLEAFGNAKTLRNDNSSRFGKWMEVVFAVGGRICAARVINYLLEKSRVVKQATGERNYHIFYQITKALPKDVKDKILLKEAADYMYLKQSGCYTIPGVDENTELGRTIKAMQNLNFSDTEIHQMWVVLSAILNLGNLKFAADKSKDGTTIANTDQLEIIAKVLQLNNATLTTALTFRSVTIRGSVSMIPLKLEEAVENCDSLAKALYGKMFDWLIKKVNETLMKVPATDDMMTIGILDIFGFEIFEQNAFEQFCINYANEKLQQHFNEHIFKLEQDEYKREKIDVSFIEFVDNLECLKLIEGNPIGILKMLDEEVTIPKGGDKSLITKMHKKFAEETKHNFYGLIRKSPEVFIIKHYAGAVVYDSTGMVNKNRDKLHDSLTDLVIQSEVALVRTIFAPEPVPEAKAETKEEKAPATPAGGAGGPTTARAKRAAAAKAAGGKATIAKGGGGGGGGAKGVRTLCVQFYAQLSSLMKTLHAANPHYIRCVKPNALKTPGTFNAKMVLRQMQYAGLFEAIRIRRAGFPFRVPHAEFVSRYRVCMKAQDIKSLNDLKGDDVKQANFLLTRTFEKDLDKKEYQMGVSKVFMRNTQRLILTRLRDAALTVCVLKIQAFQRGNNARKFYVKVKAFNEKCKKVVGDRSIETLKAILQEAADSDMDLFILRAINALLGYLEEEKRVSVILEEGCKENELASLEGGLEQVNVLKGKYPKEPWADYYSKLVAQAESQKQALIRKDRARKGIATAIQNEDIKELQAAIQEAKDAGLAPADWAEAQKLLERLEYEEQCIQDLEKAVASTDLQAIEEKLVAAEQVTLDAKRKEIIGNAKETLKKGHFEKMKAHMISADKDLPNHLPTHEGDVPADQLPLPPEEKVLTETIIPKLESLKYHDLLQQAKAFLLDQLKKRLQAQKEAHFNHLQATLKSSEEESKKLLPNFEVDTPAKDLPLPPLEAKIKEDIIPRLEKLEYKEYVTEASLFLEKQLGHRVQALLESHHEHLQTSLKLAEEDTKNHIPNHEIDTPAPEIPLPPVEKDIKEKILPKLTKLGYNDFVGTAEAFLAAQLSARESALKHAHHDYLEVIIKDAEKESPQYMPSVENDKPVETLPPAEQKIKDHVSKLTKLNFLDLLNTANGFLEAQQSKREAESLRIITEKKEAERKRLEEEERIRREEERKKREEEERRRLEEERKKEEERLAAERAQLQEAERKRLEEEDKKRREAEEKALADRLARERAEEEAKAKALAEEKEREAQKAREAAEKKRLETEAKLEEQRRKNEADYQQQKAREEKEKEAAAKKLAEQRSKQEEDYRREKEEQEKKQRAIEEAEKAAQSAAEASKAKVRAHVPVYPPGTVGADGLPPPPPDDDFNMPPPPPPEDLKWQAPETDSQELQQAETREEELNKAIKARSLSLITTLLVDADKFGDKTRTVRIARNLKDVLTEERKILNQLKQCLKELNVNPLKSLLREAANLGLDNPVISEARHLCYGMSKSELLTKRITLALKNRDAEKLNALLDEAKEDGIENEEVEHARDFVAMTLDLGDWNSKMRVARSRTVSGISASQAASYKGFLETKGLYPLRKFTNLRKEGNYAKKNYFRKKNLKKKRLVWQKEDIPRSLVKLSTSHCGGQKKSKLVKKIAKQIFKNIRGYMGDHYHAYPVTLAYEVVNTGVNEELLRDEIFAQLIKQTTKNPSLDSRTLGWKLLYLCVSTFWPSQELRPILVSHLAAHAPPKINKREFGFNTIADLAYHCYIALDDKSPPANEPPSMADIEKITNGTLGAVKSFFSMDPDEDEEGEAKGEPTTVTENMDAELEQNGVAPPADPFPPTPAVVFKAAPPPPPPQPRASQQPSQPHPPMDGPPPPDD